MPCDPMVRVGSGADGLAIGAACAAIAVAPAWLSRGDVSAVSRLLLLLAAVGAAGLGACAIATRAASRGPLLDALRTE